MNRRRILAALASFCVIGLCALLLTSLPRTRVKAAVPAAGPAAPAAAGRPESALGSPAGLAIPAAPEPAPQQTEASLVPEVDPHRAFGSKSAKVVIEIFSDFQCPACKQLYINTNRQLMDNYVNTGKVYLIARDYPLPMHAHSRVAARYGRAAAQLGKFEVVERALFENQEKWEQNGDVDATVAAVLSPADMAKVRNLVKSGTLETAIEKDIALGRTYNVNQTPTSVFHSKGQTFPYSGGMSYEIFRQFIDQLLK